MSDSGRIIAKALADIGSNAIVISGDCVGQINPYVEWVKWLSYESEEEKKIVNSVDGKISSEVSYDELQKMDIIKRNRMFAGLFKKYGASECSKEEYMKVYDYMCTESIVDLMKSKLSSEELCYAKEKIIYFSQLPSEELSKKVHEEQKKEFYDKLSMVDSYVLHMLSDINYYRSEEDLREKIEAQNCENNVMSQRGLYYAPKTSKIYI